MNRKKPIILLSVAETRPSTYQQAIRVAGGDSVGGYLPECIIPESFDGILLGGGGDLNPAWYGEPNKASGALDPNRDALELKLLRRAVEQKCPVLGICRGMQFLNVVFGGSLIQELGVTHSMVGTSYRMHGSYTAQESCLATLYGAQCVINSGHHQAVNALAPDLHATQWASDGVIEGIEHQSLPIIGVQWHPEKMCNLVRKDGQADGLRLFCAFIAFCEKLKNG